MNTVGVIPARHGSTRLPGKPLADIEGRPMVWWVWRRAKQAAGLDEVLVATDDENVRSVCESFGIRVLMTSSAHPTHVDRLHEVSLSVGAELYVCICGDEPLIMPETISAVIPPSPPGGFVARTLIRAIRDPTEALDPSNIKAIVDSNDECLLLTRAMAPFPYRSLDYRFKKLVGIECYSRDALNFFAHTRKGELETIEDITLLRFVENRMPLQLVMTDAYQLGVDTPKDLDRVRAIIRERAEGGI